MLNKLFDSLPSEAIFGVLAMSGGIARVVAGVKTNPAASVVGEAARLVFVALPIGVICGMWAQDVSSSEVIPLAVSFAAGVLSLNVVRFMLSDEGLGLIKFYLRRIFNGKG